MSATRLERLRGELDRAGVATLLVTSPANVRYLTGFESSNAAVLTGPDRTKLLTDGRYIEAARALRDVEVVQSSRDLTAFLGERLRAVKEPEELDAIHRAAALTNEVYERLAAEGGAVGATEAELAWRLAGLFQEVGADELAFPAIAASGPNAARPHHRPGARRIEAGETLIVDMGARLSGYASDCTRTFATGPLPDELARAYEACLEAQEAALAAVRPGAAAREVDAVARERLEGAGYETLHGLGHGLGLEVHEAPRLADTSDAVLEAGNVVTVEPGVYLAGLGGIRIEDLVIVRDDAPEVLTTFTKRLVTIG